MTAMDGLSHLDTLELIVIKVLAFPVIGLYIFMNSSGYMYTMQSCIVGIGSIQ